MPGNAGWRPIEVEDLASPDNFMDPNDADFGVENIKIQPNGYNVQENLALDNPSVTYGNAQDPSPHQQSVAGEDEEDEDLEEIVPDEMDYTHEDSFRYLEMQRQRDE